MVSAHAALGREWEFVVIAGLQEGLWPNVVPRGGVLATQQLVDVLDGIADGTSTRAPLLAEERRLLVAALGRARSHVLVTAVDGDEGDDALLPSPFCDELAALATERPGRRRRTGARAAGAGARRRWSAGCGRWCAHRTGRSTTRRVRCAATQLARLAEAGVPGSAPAQWYAHHRGVDRAAAVVGRRARRDAVPVDAADAHRLPAAVAAGTPRRQRRSRRALGARHARPRPGVRHREDRGTDARRARIGMGRSCRSTPQWHADNELDRHRRMLTAFVEWRAQTRGELTEVGTEVDVDGVVAPGGADQPGVRVRGRVDRLERDAEGRLVVVDVKTGKSPVSKDDAQRHAQLAMYQLAIAEGVLPQGDEAGGGRLVYLGKIGVAGATERDQNPMTAEGRDEWRDRVHQAAGATRGPEFVARVNDGCAHCPVRAMCPAQAAIGGTLVTARYSPAELADALGLFAPTDEQAAVIAAPPGPLVVIAGAGAGKTETMAARVVWLVANGYARPGEVLGLTFTRKAAGQLLRRVRTRLARLAGAGLVPGDRADVDEHPSIGTYHAFAGTLLREHGLLLPVEPSTRLIGATELWQLAFRVVCEHPDVLDTEKSPATVTAMVLRLAGQLAEHLVDTDQLRDTHVELERLVHTLPAGPRQRDGGPSQSLLKLLATQTERTEIVPLIDALHERMRAENVMDFGMQMAAAARLACDVPAGRRAAAAALPGGAARRVPGHRPRAARGAVGAVRWRGRRRAGADGRR